MKGRIFTTIAGVLLVLICAQTAPTQTLTADEEVGLNSVRQVQKLVRDVYLELSENWNAPLFNSIADAEANHTDSILGLYENYNVFDELAKLSRGEFPIYEYSLFFENLTYTAIYLLKIAPYRMFKLPFPSQSLSTFLL